MREFFHKFSNKITPVEWTDVFCDVASHISVSSVLRYKNKSLNVSMIHNPSHLESVNPVSLGKTFSKSLHGLAKEQLLNVMIHGDAALAGQGINFESLQLTKLKDFDVEGTVHVVCNNQVGFTSELDNQSSTYFSTDIFKAFDIPIIHVNTYDFESAKKAAMVAIK